MEHNNRKIYYTMGEVSEMFDVNASLIRFWEQKFDVLKPDKNRKGNRLFTPTDVDNLKLIYHLVKENGMTLAGAAKRLRENREGVERNLEIIEKLQGIKALLLEVREELKSGGDNEVFVDPVLRDEPLRPSVLLEELPDNTPDTPDTPETNSPSTTPDDTTSCEEELIAAEEPVAQREESKTQEVASRPLVIEQSLF